MSNDRDLTKSEKLSRILAPPNLARRQATLRGRRRRLRTECDDRALPCPQNLPGLPANMRRESRTDPTTGRYPTAGGLFLYAPGGERGTVRRPPLPQ